MDKGRRFAGDTFPPVKTEEEAHREMAEQAAVAGNPDAIDLDTYFNLRGIRNSTMQAAMRAYTVTIKATREAWDSIFESF